MGFFDRESRLNGIDPAIVDSAQAGSDPRTEVPEYIKSIWFDATLAGQHPWAISDGELLKVAYLGAAYVGDVAAETLREATFTDHKHERLDPDVAWFAENLSTVAKDKMRQALGLQLSQLINGQVFDEGTLITLMAENNMPYWPRTPYSQIEDWQSKDMSAPVMSARLLRPIIKAAELVELDACDTLDVMLGKKALQTGSAIKTADLSTIPEYSAVATVIADIQNSGRVQLDAASEALDNTKEPGAAYKSAHDGFIAMTTAYMAALCPPVLGESFLPNR
ncbi:MAG TPA: hypothetical protein VLG16_05005 [Candidatus Saccharimonadales bacterium]|nr:hypothetical protein [Candidatus Saccharimonadales bacterium]